MKKWHNLFAQGVLILGQAFTWMEPYLNADGKIILAISIGILQGILSAIAHHYNPDGTPAEASYEK